MSTQVRRWDGFATFAWVNVVYIKGGGNGQAHPNLRRC